MDCCTAFINNADDDENDMELADSNAPESAEVGREVNDNVRRLLEKSVVSVVLCSVVCGCAVVIRVIYIVLLLNSMCEL